MLLVSVKASEQSKAINSSISLEQDLISSAIEGLKRQARHSEECRLRNRSVGSVSRTHATRSLRRADR